MATKPYTKHKRMKCFPIFSNEDFDLSLVAWSTDDRGYAKRTFTKESRVKYAHRIVLARMTGRELSPKEFCDHINRKKLDNQRGNLRIATAEQNSQNLCPRGASGIRGVTFHRRINKWQASVKHRGKFHYCGVFDSPELAGEAA